MSIEWMNEWMNEWMIPDEECVWNWGSVAVAHDFHYLFRSGVYMIWRIYDLTYIWSDVYMVWRIYGLAHIWCGAYMIWRIYDLAHIWSGAYMIPNLSLVSPTICDYTATEFYKLSECIRPVSCVVQFTTLFMSPEFNW
jgi:hypothetical protein